MSNLPASYSIESGPNQPPHNQLERRQPFHQTPEIAEQATNVFHGASGFEIQGGQFNSAAGHIIMQLPQTHNVDQVQTGNLASIIPPTTPEERESVTYARLLWSKGRGYPLWSPKPSSNLPDEYTIHGVHIGDVGIITADGAFDFLFNICKPADHPINFNGVPPGFTPLGEPDPSTVASDIEFSARSYLMSKSMRGTSSSMSFNDEHEALNYSFVCHSAEGALLLLPEGAFRQDLQNLGMFRRYAAQYGGSWYGYANGEQLGREASNGSIHLVTGFDKGNSWAVAAFSNAPLTHAHPRIDLELHGQKVHTEAGRSYYWDQSGPARLKYGPVPVNSPNQCIFLRSFSVSLSMRLWGKILGVVEVTKTTDAPFERFSPNNLFVPSQGSILSLLWKALTGTSSSRSDYSTYLQQPEVMVTSTFVTGESHHPGRVVNSFLLNNRPDAEVAISHDYQWAPLASRFNNIDEDKVSQYILADFDVEMKDGKAIFFPVRLIIHHSTGAVFLVNTTGNGSPLRDDNLNEFPLSSCDVRNFERALTLAYCQSPYARERRPKNLVQSISRHMERELQHQYLVVKIKNHDDGFTSLKLEHAPNQSFRDIPTFVSNYAAMDVIEVFDDHGKGKEVIFLEVLFTNDFTLHDLSMIARTVHEVGAKIPWTESSWFVATVAKVAVLLYNPTDAGQSMVDRSIFALFEKLKDANEQLIREAVEAVRRNLARLEEAEATATAGAKRAVREADHAWDEARRVGRAELGVELAVQNTPQGGLANSEAEQARQQAHHARELAKQADHKVDQARREVLRIVEERAQLRLLLAQNEIQEEREEQGAEQPPLNHRIL